jgi:hypothetical protein
MRISGWLTALLGSFLLCAPVVAAKEVPLQSGPQVGKDLPGPFNPVNVTNADLPDRAGTRNDYTEQYGANPVVLVFARELSEPLTTLARKLDAEVARNRPARLKAVLVVLSDDAAIEKQLKALAQKQGLKNVSLAFLEPAGPKNYKLSPEAEVTVILSRRGKVEANHAFKKGGLDKKTIAAVLADVPRIVAQRE